MQRRHRAALRAAAVGLLIVLSSGCGGGGSRSTSAARRESHPLPLDTLHFAMAEPGRYGGRFVIGQTSSAKTFNPMVASGSSTTDVVDRLYTSLVDIDYQTQVDIPLLARSWSISADQREYTFRLRRGAAFSDGHPLTSEDVVFSWTLATDDTLGSSLRTLLQTNGVKWTMTAVDSYTVVLRLPAPYATALPNAGAVRIVPKHRLEAAYRNGTYTSAYGTNTPPESLVTSGPWRLGEFVPDQKTVLVPNPYWFGVDEKGQRLPYLDELVYRIAKDQATGALRFHAGELDAIDNVKPEDYADYERRQQAEHYTLHDLGPSLNTNFFWFNLNLVRKPGGAKRVGEPEVEAYKYAWFVNPVFRRAVSRAIDRDAIIKGPFYGYALKNFGFYTVANKLWHADSLPADDYDPESSRALLAGLGFRDTNGDGILEDSQGHPVSFTLKFNADNNVRAAMAGLLQEDLRKVGIEAIPAGLDFNTLTTNLSADYQYEACLLGLQTSVPPDPGIGSSAWLSSGMFHYWHAKQARPTLPIDRTLDELFGRVNATLEYPERKRICDAMQRALNEECMYVWLPTQLMRVPVSNRFGNVRPSVMPHRILWNIDRVFEKSGRR